MTSDPGILTTTVYSWEYCTSTSSSAAPPLQLSPPLPSHPAALPVPRSWLWHHLEVRLLFLPTAPALAWALTLHLYYNTSPRGKSFQGPRPGGGLLPSPPAFPSSLILCASLCPACPDLEPLPDGSPSRCLIAIANTPVISRSFPHFFQLLPAVKSCLSFISQVLSPLRKFSDSSVWIYCFSYVLIHSFHKYFVSSYYVADVVLARGDIMVTEMDIVSVLTELSI